MQRPACREMHTAVYAHTQYHWRSYVCRPIIIYFCRLIKHKQTVNFPKLIRLSYRKQWGEKSEKYGGNKKIAANIKLPSTKMQFDLQDLLPSHRRAPSQVKSVSCCEQVKSSKSMYFFKSSQVSPCY